MEGFVKITCSESCLLTYAVYSPNYFDNVYDAISETARRPKMFMLRFCWHMGGYIYICNVLGSFSGPEKEPLFGARKETPEDPQMTPDREPEMDPKSDPKSKPRGDPLEAESGPPEDSLSFFRKGLNCTAWPVTSHEIQKILERKHYTGRLT